MKTCSVCGIEKTLDSFSKQAASRQGYRNQCKVCTNATVRARMTPEKRRAHHLRYTYRIEIEQYELMYAEQNGSCKICLMNFELLHVDHCHTTGNVRGLLCGNCNRAMGIMNDNIENIQRMVTYLKETL